MDCNCKNKKKIRSEEEKKVIINRINKIKGQINGISNMINSDAYCEDILIQLAAISKAIKSVASVMIDNHLHSCILSQIKDGNDEAIDEIVELFKRFL